LSENRPLLPFERHVIPNGQNRDCKISMAKYLRNWSTTLIRWGGQN